MAVYYPFEWAGRGGFAGLKKSNSTIRPVLLGSKHCKTVSKILKHKPVYFGAERGGYASAGGLCPPLLRSNRATCKF
jgi:hypothetical protein